MDYDEFLKALFSTLVAGGIGGGLAALWGRWQKRREQAQASANEFYRCYGEFFELWKLWNTVVDQGTADSAWEARRWDLLVRAAHAEAAMEALYVKISTELVLSAPEIAALGCFRQGYQVVRESIRDRKRIDWNTSNHPDYLAFKRLSSVVARLAAGVNFWKVPSQADARNALVAITANDWRDRWAEERRP